jgi:hypothetical protein
MFTELYAYSQRGEATNKWLNLEKENIMNPKLNIEAIDLDEHGRIVVIEDPELLNLVSAAGGIEITINIGDIYCPSNNGCC